MKVTSKKSTPSQRTFLWLLALAFVLGTPTIWSATTIWTGAQNTDFSLAANWSNGVPNLLDTAIFSSDYNTDCALTQDVTIGTILTNNDYDGQLILGSRTLTIRQSADFSGFVRPWQQVAANLVMAGDGGTLTVHSGQELANLEIQNTTTLVAVHAGVPQGDSLPYLHITNRF
jgi:hypothetical protein